MASIHFEWTSMITKTQFQQSLCATVSWVGWPKANYVMGRLVVDYIVLYTLFNVAIYLRPPHITASKQFHFNHPWVGEMQLLKQAG